MPTNYTQSTTQEYLDIYDITNNLVVMKDGSTSMILTVDAMNFGLLAEEEQDAVMYAYAGLLNSLNYPIQVIVKSQTKDVTSYLQRLKEQEIKASSRLNQERIGRYREFVSNLIRERNVLDKKFYVVIPATAIELGIVPASSVLPGKQSFNAESVDKPVLLEKAQTVLEPKRDHIVSQFARIGLYSRQLETQEIIQLFYVSYNPEAAEGQQLGETQSYASPLVSTFSEEVAVPEVVPVSEEPVGEVPISQSQPEADPALAQVSGATVNPDSLRQLTDRHDEAEIDMTSNNQPQPEANPPLAEITTLVDKSTNTQPEVMGEMSTSPQQSDEKIPPPTIPKAIFSGPTSAPSTDEVQTQIYSDLAQTNNIIVNPDSLPQPMDRNDKVEIDTTDDNQTIANKHQSEEEALEATNQPEQSPQNAQEALNSLAGQVVSAPPQPQINPALVQAPNSQTLSRTSAVFTPTQAAITQPGEPTGEPKQQTNPPLVQVDNTIANLDSLRQLTDRHDEAEIDMTSNNQPQPEANLPLVETPSLPPLPEIT